MKLVLPFAAFAGAMAQNNFLPPSGYQVQPQQQVAQPMGGMDPMMMMLMMGDGKSSMKDLLPLMMMSGGMGGGAGGMDPMMMMLLMGDDSSSSSTKDLLPLMMMSGGMGGDGAQGGMNPLLMMSLMEDSCEVKSAAKSLTASDDDKKAIAKGEKCYDSTNKKAIACAKDADRDATHVDHDFIKCDTGSSGMSDLLPLMMMGGGMGGDAGGMNSMLPLMLMGDSSSSMSDLLPLMMMGGGMGGQAGGMDPMMMMLMMDGDSSTKKGCDSKFKVGYAYKKSDKTKITGDSAIRTEILASNILGTSTWATDYKKCLDAAKEEGSDSSSLKDLLPLMMMSGGMGGQGGMGGMDPMMMMMMLD